MLELEKDNEEAASSTHVGEGLGLGLKFIWKAKGFKVLHQTF